jgi:flagellar basal body-associated protein FliL
MNLNNLKQLSFGVLYKKTRTLFARSTTTEHPVAYDWIGIILLALLVTAVLASIAIYFYFFYSASAVTTSSLETQTLTINRSELSDTLDLIETHEHFFSTASEDPRVVVDPSY